MSDVTIKGARKSYASMEVLHGIDLHIKSGEFVVFVGPSGCGKSTLLRMIAGLEEISDGTIAIGDTVVNNVAPAKRGIAMVFQNYALYPHMTVSDNMGFGLKIAGLSKSERDIRVRKAAAMLQLTDYLERLPRQLSGGQRQRVAIGRAIVRDPKVFLFDEPLSNLDAALRVATRIEIARLKESLPGTTMVYVTHDQVEAMTLADRIVVLNGGRIEQVGSPLELYDRPANLFVARFIGSPAMNIVDAEILSQQPARLGVRGTTIDLPPDAEVRAQGTAVKLGVRPEDLRLAGSDVPLLSGTVSLVEHLGEVTIAYVDIGAGEPLVAKLDGASKIVRGETIHLTADRYKLHVFDAANGSACLTARLASAA
ncbi:ABC transporter ATP-binding protein (plasmid) [Aminobacter sp. UC22_36]|uniref:ABC transporter ATP-binding protein n=1 Tax=Aminobacter sp. UC22_36 TaxID=3374549 RepID=UPI0037575635